MEPDLEAIDEATTERFWELYVAWCDQHGLKPRLKGFFPWYEDNYV